MDLKLPNSNFSAKNRIEEIKNSGYHLDFTETFTHAFEIWKKIALTAGAALIVFMFIVLILFGGLFAFTIGFSQMGNLASLNFEDSSYTFIIGYYASIAIISALMIPFTAGILNMAYNADHNIDVEFGQVFQYYSSPFLKDLFLSGIVLAVINLIFSLGLEMMNLQILAALIAIILSFLTFLTIPLIIFGKLNFSDAIMGSITVVSKNMLIIVGLLIVSFIFALAGFIVFCIGYLFTVPLVYALYYSIYKKSVGFNNSSNELNKDRNYEMER